MFHSDLDLLIKKVGKTRILGSSTKVGRLYHDLPFGPDIKVHRSGTELRAKLITDNYDVKRKFGLDLGCSVGGITFRLQLAGAYMMGVDYDPQALAVANYFENQVGTGATFVNEDIALSLLRDLHEVDFIVWLDQWMWFHKEHGRVLAEKALSVIYNKCDVLFFSTSQGDGQAKNFVRTPADVEQLLKDNTEFKVANLGTVQDNWHRRSTFMCTK